MRKIPIDVRYANGRFCKTVHADSKYSAKQLIKHYKKSGMLAEVKHTKEKIK